MSWLFEDPTTMIAAGVLIEALLAVVLVKTGRGLAIVAMLGVLALVGLGVVVERLVVTETEEVQDALDAIAQALEANDVDRVLSHIDPQAAGLRSTMSNILSRARIREARVRQLTVRVNRLTSPRTATADFTGRVVGSFGSQGIEDATAIRDFTVHFRRRDGRWLVESYEERAPFGRSGPGRQ